MLKILLVLSCFFGHAIFAQPHEITLEQLSDRLTDRNPSQATFVWIFGKPEDSNLIYEAVTRWITPRSRSSMVVNDYGQFEVPRGLARNLDYIVVNGISNVQHLDQILESRKFLSPNAVVFFLDTHGVVDRKKANPLFFENSVVISLEKSQCDLTSDPH